MGTSWVLIIHSFLLYSLLHVFLNDVRHDIKVLTQAEDSYNQSVRILMRMGVRYDLISLKINQGTD